MEGTTYSQLFCKVYDAFGWNYYPEIFGQQLLLWLQKNDLHPKTAMDLACGTGILCRILRENGIRAAGMDFSEGMIQIARRVGDDISYEVADMITYRPDREFDLVTCTGDAINHIAAAEDVQKIFENVHHYLAPGGYFVFDILNEREISDSEPFEMDYDGQTRVWFQMTQPVAGKVNLKIRVFEEGQLQFEENIRETVHDPVQICQMLEKAGLRVLQCADRLLPDSGPGTTWFVIAQKERRMEHA